MELQCPYLLFLGDVADQLAAKTAQGLKDWRPDWCLGQYRLPDCKADLGIPDLTREEAFAQGAALWCSRSPIAAVSSPRSGSM